MANKTNRKLNAVTLGPFTMLMLLTRFRKGEPATHLSVEYNVSKSTLWRWHHKYADDIDQFQTALISGYMQADLEALLKTIEVAKTQMNRQHAILNRLLKPGQRYLKNQRGAPDELRPRRKKKIAG